MENVTNENKIILACAKEGMLKEIFLDSGSLLENIKLPADLKDFVSPDSKKEMDGFWNSIQEKSMGENTIIVLIHKDKHFKYMFSGYLLEDTVLLCGNTELTAAEKALEEIMVINREQANQIRLFEKEESKRLGKDEKRIINQAFLNDFTSLNSELVNNQRELMLKNRKIELLNEELKTANENLSLFTYSVSHDLKEPVRMMNSFLALLHKNYSETLDQKGKTYLNFALDGANRLSNMMKDLLKYHQSSDLGSIELVDLNEVLSEVKKILSINIEERNAQITCVKLPSVNGSATGLIQVFQNLISNAIKFVPPATTPVISIDLKEDDFYFTILIKDNGIGIAENQKQNVFNLFKRLNVSEKYEGTGMGLAMVKKSVERMGGEIGVESEEGKGSTFFFTIKKTLLA